MLDQEYFCIIMSCLVHAVLFVALIHARKAPKSPYHSMQPPLALNLIILFLFPLSLFSFSDQLNIVFPILAKIYTISIIGFVVVPASTSLLDKLIKKV